MLQSCRLQCTVIRSTDSELIEDPRLETSEHLFYQGSFFIEGEKDDRHVDSCDRGACRVNDDEVEKSCEEPDAVRKWAKLHADIVELGDSAFRSKHCIPKFKMALSSCELSEFEKGWS